MGRAIADFFKTGTGRLVAFFVLCAFIILIIFGFGIGRKQAEIKATDLSDTLSHRNAQPSGFDSDVLPIAPAPHKDKARPQPETVTQSEPVPISIFSSETNDTSLSDDYAPYGRLIKCKLVNSVDSSRIETPVIGLTTEDVCRDGRVIIPAGSEVHGTAQVDRSRDRIATQNQWVIVYNTTEQEELNVKGVALAADVSPSGQSWGPPDGSAGLMGTVVKSDNLAELKLFAATFLSAAVTGLQSQGQDEFSGNSVYQNTPRNAALGGASAVINQYAQQMLQQIQANGFYVHVSGGTDFYLYVMQPMDRNKAERGASLQVINENANNQENGNNAPFRPIKLN